MNAMKPCPYCGKSVPADAPQCSFCHNMLPSATQQVYAAPAASTIYIQQAAPAPEKTKKGNLLPIATLIVLGLAVAVDIISCLIPIVGPLIGALVYEPLYLIALVLSIICLCKSHVGLGCLGIFVVVVLPWVLAIVMPILFFGMQVSAIVNDPVGYLEKAFFIDLLESPTTQPGGSTYRTEAKENLLADAVDAINEDRTDKLDPNYLTKEDVLEELRESANRGNANAQYQLGKWYQKGWIGERNHSQAVKWYRTAADRNSAAAQRALAQCYFYGLGVNPDKEKAMELYRTASDRGDALATYYFGLCYFNGEGMPKDISKAKQLLKKAFDPLRKEAEKGYAEAQSALGTYYDFGLGGQSVNTDEAMKWYRKAAAQNDPYGQYCMGDVYYCGRKSAVHINEREALKWFIESAQQDFVPAMNALGVFFEYADEGTKDMNEALKWYKKAREHGNREATERLKELGY